jgi:hypothetical protein
MTDRETARHFLSLPAVNRYGGYADRFAFDRRFDAESVRESAV